MDIEVILYRIVCELINNSLKHSGASVATVSLVYADGVLRLDYRDNGCGFDVAKVEQKGMGIANIQSRVSSLKGDFALKKHARPRNECGGRGACVKRTVMERTCKIVLADDHTLFRNGLKTLLSGIRNFEVTGEASDGCELLELLGRETPDVVLLDIEMPKMNGIVAAEEALKRWPDLRIITLSMYGDEDYYFKMVSLGVKGFILKKFRNQGRRSRDRNGGRRRKFFLAGACCSIW